MSTVTIEENVVNPSEDTQEGAPMPEADAETAAKMVKNDEVINKIAVIVADTIDPKDLLKKYCKIGKLTHDHAVWQKHQFPAFDAEDFKRLCDKIADLVKFKVAVKDVRISDYVRCYLWVEAVKPMVPNVERLSFFQVVNKFLPTLSFSQKDLDAEIRKGWLEWVKTTVATQVSDEPMTIKQLDASISERKAEIEAEAAAKKSPEQVIEAERRAALAQRAKKESNVREAITTGIDDALGGILTPTEVMGIIEKVAKDRKVALPNVGNAASTIMDAAKTMNADEARAFARALFAADNRDAINALKKTLDLMVKTYEVAPALQADAA